MLRESNQYSTLQQFHLEQLREEILGNREDVSVKNRKLSAETNKRRRELVNRKKARETEEEKRRNEILAERKARIKDVTHRYQRGSAPKSNTQNHSQRVRSPPSRTQKRAFSAPSSRNNQITLDDAFKTIRGGSQLQYNVGDSAAVFLQKYGAHLHTTTSTSEHRDSNRADATSQHSQSVRDHSQLHNNTSMFEQQLLQHQVTLEKAKSDAVQVFNGRLIEEMRLDNARPPELFGSTLTKQDDTQSIESLDSLESEQPSYRSHAISLNGRMGSNNNNNSSPQTSNLSTGGGGTYRQESPTVIGNDYQKGKASPAHNRIQSAPAYRQSTMTSATATTEPNSLLGFQVVSTDGYRLSKQNSPNSTYTVNGTKPPPASGDTSETIKPGEQTNSIKGKQDSNDALAFYLKSRTESQPLVSEFPAHAWGTPENTSRTEYEPEKHSLIPSETFQSALPPENNAFMHAETFSDTASDSGAPRSILKRRGNKSATLPRSQSTPSIRDSLELTKQHLKSGGSRVETPKSAKKSVRFCEGRSEPVFFQKGSSPSSIPRPISSKPKISNNVPHISSAITPNVSDKSIAGKGSSTQHKGPVVANHNIHVTSPAKTPDNAVSESGRNKPSNGILDIRLDRTPTDDEIDILWDKVRDCLHESPASSVRSAPADLQQAPTNAANPSGLPPKPPIKKITASNINDIGRAPSAGPRWRSTGDLSAGQSPLQRPKQNQKSFIHHHQNEGGQSSHGMVNGHMAGAGGQAASDKGPTPSALEPNLSSQINNTPRDVSESMMSYLTAEQLANQESLTDQDIMKAMSDTEYRQQVAGTGSRPGMPMSALSMEEQRILQSLDRLDNKLKAVEDGSNSSRSHQGDHQQESSIPYLSAPTMYNGLLSPNTVNHNGFTNTLTSTKVQLKPHPPYSGGAPGARSFSATSRGFRGHKPIHPRQRTSSADAVRHNGMTATLSGSNRQFRLY